MTQIGRDPRHRGLHEPRAGAGRQADKRSDVWAFGCVLYEMLTGQRAFKGDDIADTLAAVLRAEPSWLDAAARHAAAVRRLLRRCLQKDPRRRLQHIGDARLELAEAGAIEPETASQLQPPRRRARRFWPLSPRRRAGAAIAGLVGWMLVPRARWPRPVSRFSIQAPDLVCPVVGAGSRRRPVADGRTLVYVAGGARPGS